MGGKEEAGAVEAAGEIAAVPGGEPLFLETELQKAELGLPLGGEGDVPLAVVALLLVPLDLAVADEVDPGSRHLGSFACS
jgi:hypothetical protein